MTHEGNHQEKAAVATVKIVWDENARNQKFVDFIDKDGNYYVYSCPKAEASEHVAMITRAAKELGLVGLDEMGGGFIKKDKDTIVVSGESFTLKKSFNSEKTIAALQKEFPGYEIIFA